MKSVQLLFLALALLPLSGFAKDEPLLSIGVAKVDITPEYPVRLHGYGARRTNSTGVAQHLFAKAIAFGTDRQGPSILFTVDNLAVSGAITDEVAARLKKRAGIDREQVALCSSHTHSAPMLSNVAPNIFSSDIIPEQLATIDRYTRELVDNLERVALAALSNRAPSKLSWSEGTVRFAKNRRVIRDGRAQFGDNDTAPVDHTLATMFVHGADGKLRGVLVNYACHCTTLGGEWNQIHGDWSGYAQEAIERDHPGVIGLVSIGCGADANPSPRGNADLARNHGNEIGAEVSRLLALRRTPLTKLPDGKIKRFNLDFDPLPTRAQWEERAKKPGIVGYHAQKNLARLDRGEKLPTKLPYITQSWTFGNELAMVFLAGEVVIDYERRLKREFDSTRLWVNGYANDVPCYIPSRRILTEGGYEAEDSLWYYDRPARLAMSNEDRIIQAVHDLLPGKFEAKKQRAENDHSLSPAQALKSMRTAPEFTVELAAAEPLVVDPVAIDWGADGKLWVVEMRDYPMGMDGNWKPGGVVKFLEDRNGDGRYDKATAFLGDLPFPTAVFAWRKGVLICAAPDILYAEDTNGDGRADVVRKVFTGFATNNYQARVNSLSLGLDNWIYGANGLLGGNIRYVGNSTAGPSLDIRGRDFRMNPDTGALEPASGLTQQGRVRDDFGNWFGCDNSHFLWHYPMADQYTRRNPQVAMPSANVHVPQGREWNRLFPASQTAERFNDQGHANRATSACGVEIYRDELLGPEFYGNAFTCEPVHNLVHREVLTPEGVTFRSTRAASESNREFLASTDNSFRPVQVRTGPDGALWVVDMYREVIEHPRWIPSNRLAQLDVRAGADKGRIYRVFPQNVRPRPIQNFAKFSTRELAAALDSPCGTERDIIHRELLNRGDASAAQTLRAISVNSPRPAVRVQALSALGAIRQLTPDVLSLALARETDPSARAQILSFGNHWKTETLRTAASDTNAVIRLQAALNAGTGDSATNWLQPLVGEATTNAWMRAALLSSCNGSVARQLLRPAIELGERQRNLALADGLFATLMAREPLLPTTSSVMPSNEGEATPWRLRNSIAVMNVWRQKLAEGWPDEPAKRGERESSFNSMRVRMAQICRGILNNPQAAPALRNEARKMMATVFEDKADVEILEASLRAESTRTPTLNALLAGDSPRVPEFFVPRWREFTVEQRERILNGLASRAGWSGALLSAVESNSIAPAEVSALVRNRLMASEEAGVRKRAEKLWPKRTSERPRVVAEYRKAMTSTGNSERGAVVFNNNCAACHQLSGRGTAVGPDLTPLRNKSVEDFLVAILDPNAALEPRYVNYIVQMNNGAVYFGVIRSETATGVEIVSPGVHETLLRSEIAKIEASPTSLMPEGLEQSISPAEMNDLMAFLHRTAPRAFGSATSEQIRAARQEFREQQPNGFAQLVNATEQLDYPSWLGRLPLLHCRQSDGKGRVTWQPAAPKQNGEEYIFTLPVAMGFLSQPAGAFTLKINGVRAFDFNVTLEDSTWQSADGKVRASYRVMEANAEDSNGVLTLVLPRDMATTSPTPTFEVTGSAAESQRWFGIYKLAGLL